MAGFVRAQALQHAARFAELAMLLGKAASAFASRSITRLTAGTFSRNRTARAIHAYLVVVSTF